jgi:hypothetical protein
METYRYILYVSNTVLQKQLLQFKQEFLNTFHDCLFQYKDYRDF